MLSELREILLTQYIGAILIALLGWQALIEIITMIVRLGFWCYGYLHSQSVLVRSVGPFPWDSLIFSAVTVVLYVLTAYALARWLYPATSLPTVVKTESESAPGQSEQP